MNHFLSHPYKQYYFPYVLRNNLKRVREKNQSLKYDEENAKVINELFEPYFFSSKLYFINCWSSHFYSTFSFYIETYFVHWLGNLLGVVLVEDLSYRFVLL